jgi:hypothetical protein
MAHIYAIVVTDEEELGFALFAERVNARMSGGAVGVYWLSNPLIARETPDDFHAIVLHRGCVLTSLDADDKSRAPLEALRAAVQDATSVLRSLHARIDVTGLMVGLEDVLDHWDAWAALVQDPEYIEPGLEEAGVSEADRAQVVGDEGALAEGEVSARTVDAALVSLGQRGRLDRSAWGVAVTGEVVARTLENVRAVIADPQRFSPTAWALDKDAVALRQFEALPRAKAFSVIAAVDAVTRDVGVQEAACRALRQAADAAGINASLARVGERVEHAGVMALLSAAIGIARAQSWELSQGVALPDGPPSEAELHEIYLVNQVIEEIFFGTEHDCGTQFERTWAFAEVREAELRAIAGYLDVHREAVLALHDRPERRSRLRAWRRVPSRLRTAWASRRSADDVPF